MRKQMKLFIFILLLGQQCIHGQTQHVVLISIDGLRPTFYLDSTWPTPNLQKLKKIGIFSKGMNSVFPSYTYPSHAAMITGSLPARSGIYYNAPRGSKGDWYWFADSIKVPTLWQACKKAGLTSAAIQWPISVSSDITFNVPEIWNPLTSNNRISETRKYATKGLIEEMEQNATGALDSTNMNESFLGLDDNTGRMASYIFKAYHPNLLAVHFAGVDGKEHEYGPDHEEVRFALANVDHALGVIIETIQRSGLEDSTTILIVGDHGFCKINKVLKPNLWLKDINASFQAAGGSAFLYPNNPTEREVIIHQVTEKLNALPAEYKSLFKILDRNSLNKKGVDSNAALALSALPGTVFSNALKGEQLSSAEGGHHGYDPDIIEMRTGFIAIGKKVKTGELTTSIGVKDISPLIAELLKLPFKPHDGLLLKELLN